MPSRNVISWSSMLDGYVRWGQCEESLELFSQMKEENKVMPNEYTMSILLAACEHLGSLEHGKWAHAYVYKLGMEINVVLGNSLIEMYAKCGSIVWARLVFESLGPKKDLMAWSAMISGLAMHGHWEDCLSLFSNMVENGVRPDDITFLGVLSACVHGGSVSQGKAMFERMSKEFGISPSVQHYGCMIDLYGRAGLIDEAWDLLNTMPMEPDVLIWGALLSGARICGDIETCEIALNKIIEQDPTNSAAYVLLSNVYTKMGRWKDARHIRDLMKTKRVKRVPGLSSIEAQKLTTHLTWQYRSLGAPSGINILLFLTEADSLKPFTTQSLILGMNSFSRYGLPSRKWRFLHIHLLRNRGGKDLSYYCSSSCTA
ncbi:hypothetical protein K7X08_005808 [Anisodus acutangulus]|uniref:Pentatricopeptide repeat-containing protein n=1 Tax=Anisodus acutangulus TaxID=402998 RepID=A0A9Q1LU24_9SOLA|nr:hypothetical protein K7X08_005808 [Anisodus acutangulus]